MTKIKLTPTEERVFDYIRKHRGITVKECSKHIGTTECRKIISNLRDKGVLIDFVWENVVDRYGNETRIKRYFIIGRKAVKNDK